MQDIFNLYKCAISENTYTIASLPLSDTVYFLFHLDSGHIITDKIDMPMFKILIVRWINRTLLKCLWCSPQGCSWQVQKIYQPGTKSSLKIKQWLKGVDMYLLCAREFNT